MKRFFLNLALGSLLILAGCQNEKQVLKVAATPVPHAEILNAVKEDLKSKGIELKIIEVDDYNLPNRLLAEKQVDATFFQHEPFLKLQEKQCGYQFVILTRVHLEPLGIYSSRIKDLKDLPSGAKVGVPSDPTNEARSLKLLETSGLIEIAETSENAATTRDIKKNPKNFKFIEMDASLLPRVLQDVEIAVIPANFALQGGLNPLRDALALESSCSPYANLLVARKGDENREELLILTSALTSPSLRDFINNRYHGAVLPAVCK